MAKIYIATRIERNDYEKIEKLVKETKLERAEIARRLILIGLKHIKKPEDLIKI